MRHAIIRKPTITASEALTERIATTIQNYFAADTKTKDKKTKDKEPTNDSKQTGTYGKSHNNSTLVNTTTNTISTVTNSTTTPTTTTTTTTTASTTTTTTTTITASNNTTTSIIELTVPYSEANIRENDNAATQFIQNILANLTITPHYQKRKSPPSLQTPIGKRKQRLHTRVVKRPLILDTDSWIPLATYNSETSEMSPTETCENNKQKKMRNQVDSGPPIKHMHASYPLLTPNTNALLDTANPLQEGWTTLPQSSGTRPRKLL
jgi:hypothetical protein